MNADGSSRTRHHHREGSVFKVRSSGQECPQLIMQVDAVLKELSVDWLLFSVVDLHQVQHPLVFALRTKEKLLCSTDRTGCVCMCVYAYVCMFECVCACVCVCVCVCMCF